MRPKVGETSKYTGPLGFLGSSNGKVSACNAGDLGSIPGSDRSLGMATHSNTLAWKIPWMEEPSRLESMGSQRVGYNSAASLVGSQGSWGKQR